MKKLLTLLAMLVCLVAANAQTDSPTVAPDRPGMATGPDITPFLKVQWETGFESTWDGNPAFLLSHSTF